MNQASTFCEWNGPAPMPPPTGARTTTGTARAPAVVGLGQVVDDLVEAAGDEVAELHLDHGPEAVQGQAQGGPQRARLDDGRVAHARLAELLDEALGDLEDAAVLGDVLAEEDDAAGRAASPRAGRR